jgi:hypothetical protein
VFGCAIALLVPPLLCAGSHVVLRSIRDARARSFLAACGASVGQRHAAADRTITEAAPGYIVTMSASPHDPNGGSRYQTHTGLASSSWCATQLSNDVVVGVRSGESHDLERCTDRGAYPRRYWLCEIGVWLIP